MNTRDEVRRMRIREWKKVFEDKAASGFTQFIILMKSMMQLVMVMRVYYTENKILYQIKLAI